VKKLIVIKVGTSTLVRTVKGVERLDGDSFRRIARQVRSLRRLGYDVVLVSSGAVTAGMVRVGVRQRPLDDIAALQRFASLGWHEVLGKWSDALSMSVGGVLLTRHSLSLKGERAEFQRVTSRLLLAGDVPIINENDVITHEEIAFGDNDTLAATVAVRLRQGYDATHLVILSDVHGVYRDKMNPATVIPVVERVEDVLSVAGGSGSPYGRGGMTTKLEAARIATEAGVVLHVAHGRTEHAVERALTGSIGTTFVIK
jgi:glutamate 5-kinase